MLTCSGPDPGLNSFRLLDPVLLFLMRRTTDLAMVLAAGQITRISLSALFKMILQFLPQHESVIRTFREYKANFKQYALISRSPCCTVCVYMTHYSAVVLACTVPGGVSTCVRAMGSSADSVVGSGRERHRWSRALRGGSAGDWPGGRESI